MRLLIIRHADPDYEKDNLTPTGKQEARMLAEFLETWKIRDFYVSPLGRTMATAEPTLERMHRKGTECQWLKEFSIPIRRPDVNGKSRIPWDWLPQDWLEDPRLLSVDQWRENERMKEAFVGEAYDAVTDQFDALLETYGYKRNGRVYQVIRSNTDTIVLFCHLGVGCVLMSHLMNCSPMVLWHGTALAPSSVSVFHTEERRPGTAVFRAASIGETAHLYARGAKPSFAARFCEVYGNGDRID